MSCWSKALGSLLIAAPVLLFAPSQSFASISSGGGVAPITPTASISKSCSGAFRYAARDGNSDIVELSPAKIFADKRRYARYAARATGTAEAAPSRLLVLTAMCGAR